MIREIDSDVSEVPRAKCEQRKWRTVYRRMRRVRSETAPCTAVCVGREERYDRSKEIGEFESDDEAPWYKGRSGGT